MNQRVCYRCLLRDLSKEDYEQQIGKYLAKIKPEEKTDDTLYEYRLSVCKSCDSLLNGTCNACGCYVELRAAAKRAECPGKRW